MKKFLLLLFACNSFFAMENNWTKYLYGKRKKILTETRQRLKRKLNLDDVTCFNITPLVYFSLNDNDLAYTRRLLAAGADPNAKNSRYPVDHLKKRYALHEAVKNGSRKTVEELLKYGADPNITAPDYCFRTPLHTICHDTHQITASHIAIARVLLSHKADPNAREALFGQTLLQSLVLWGHKKQEMPYRKQFIKILISYGASINQPRSENSSIWTMYLRNEDSDQLTAYAEKMYYLWHLLCVKHRLKKEQSHWYWMPSDVLKLIAEHTVTQPLISARS